jgi:hypothetical protein
MWNVLFLTGAGALGCGGGYYLALLADKTIMSLVSSTMVHVFQLPTTFEFILIGAGLGAMMGVAQRDWKQVKWLTLAGIIGFGSAWPCSYLMFEIIPWNNIIPHFPFYDPITGLVITMGIQFAACGLVVGGLAGALLGLGLHQKRMGEIIKEYVG